MGGSIETEGEKREIDRKERERSLPSSAMFVRVIVYHTFSQITESDIKTKGAIDLCHSVIYTHTLYVPLSKALNTDVVNGLNTMFQFSS